MVNKEMVATAKRLVSVGEGLQQAEEGVELAIGQLTYLHERETKKRTGVPARTEYKEVEQELIANIEYLRFCLHERQSSLVQALARSSKQGVVELERSSVLSEADDILKRSN